MCGRITKLPGVPADVEAVQVNVGAVLLRGEVVLGDLDDEDGLRFREMSEQL